MKYTYLGHNVNLFEIEGKKIITDPWLVGNPIVKDTVLASELDYIIVTHGHFDHIGNTLDLFQENNAIKIICNPEIGRYLMRKGVPAASISTQYIGGYVSYPEFDLKGTAAAHGSSLPDDSYGGLAMGFILRAEGKKVYISGDTGLSMEMHLLKPEHIDVAIMPIGGRFTMDNVDFRQAVDIIQPKLAIPIHYDTFPLIVHTEAEKEAVLKTHASQIVYLEVGGSKEI